MTIQAEILVKRAGVKMDAGKIEEALELFDAALGLDPKSADALLHRSNLRMLQANVAEAQKDLDACLEVRPSHLLAQLRLATVYMATNQMDRAKECLDKAGRIDARSSEVHSYRGEMHFAQNEFEDAKLEFQKAIECCPGNPTPYVNAALAMMNSPSENGGPPDILEAMALLSKSIDVDPMFQSAFVQLGQMKLSMATNLSEAREVVELYDRGIQQGRTAEELKDLCSMRLLTIAQVEAAQALGMETLNI
jgi:import receptor subunit TOM70